jgi:signal transduction histidine kinase
MASLTRIIVRPVRAATWRELAYLVLGGIMAIVAFAVVVAGLTAISVLLITLIGIPLFVGFAYLNRWLTGLERRRTAFLLREPVDGVYKRPKRSKRRVFVPTLKAVVTDSQTWKDLAWLILLSVIGFAFAVAAVTLWLVVLPIAAFPAYWWALPADSLQITDGDREVWSVDSWWLAALIGLAGVVGVIVTSWLCAGLARGEALLARLLLAPTQQQELRERVSQLEESRAAAVEAQTADLRRIERDLHDGAQARLVALTMELGRAREKMDTDPAAARELLDAAQDDARQAIVELRELVSGMHPAILSDRGLDAAITSLAARSPVPVTLDLASGARLPAATETAAYFVVAEALANVGKHSGARRAGVRVTRENARLVVEVSDDGAGGADAATGSGLAGLAGRVEALDGSLVVSSPAGGGTVVRAELPCVS